MSPLELWAAIVAVFAGIMLIGWAVNKWEGPVQTEDIRAQLRRENLARIHRNYYR